MARLTLIFDGEWGAEELTMDEPIVFDFDRFVVDDEYSNRVITHVRHSLTHLAKEVEAIGLATPLF